ncbi:MAG: preprotein translocase subunit SecE [Thermochromatium sp.]
MSSRAETDTAGLDFLKLGGAVLLLVGGILAFYYFSEVSVLLRVIALLVVSGGAAAIAFQTERGRALWQFISDSRMEVRKVVWPTRQETLQTTLVVVVMVLLLGIVLWLFDMILMSILRFLTGQGG